VERYAVEGSTVLGWTVTVEARGLEAAFEAARRIARRAGVPAGSLRIRAVDHRAARGDGAAEEEGGPALTVEIW
jgi:hypothetical protein